MPLVVNCMERTMPLKTSSGTVSASGVSGPISAQAATLTMHNRPFHTMSGR